MVTLKLRKEYLNAVTNNIAILPQTKHWTVWYMKRFYVNIYGSYILWKKQSDFWVTLYMQSTGGLTAQLGWLVWGMAAAWCCSIYIPHINLVNSRSDLRAAVHGDLAVPRSRTKRYKQKSFAVSGSTLWNSLPLSLSHTAVLCAPEDHQYHPFLQSLPNIIKAPPWQFTL